MYYKRLDYQNTLSKVYLAIIAILFDELHQAVPSKNPPKT